LPRAALGKAFAECPGPSAKMLCPVVGVEREIN